MYFDPAIEVLPIYLTGILGSGQIVWTRLFIPTTELETKCPSNGDQLNKLWYIQTIQYKATVKGKARCRMKYIVG